MDGRCGGGKAVVTRARAAAAAAAVIAAASAASALTPLGCGSTAYRPPCVMSVPGVCDGPGGQPDGAAAGDASATESGPEDNVLRADSGAPIECSLLDDTTCANQKSCYADEVLSGGTGCLPPGSMLERAGCLVQQDCSPGFVCFDARGQGKICLEICRTAIQPVTCLDVTSTMCVALPRYPGFGYCF
jgi:hypothetical protein